MSKFPNDRFFLPRKDPLDPPSPKLTADGQVQDIGKFSSDIYTHMKDTDEWLRENFFAVDRRLNKRPVSAAMASTAPFNLVADNALTTVTGFKSLWDEYKLVDLTNSQIIIPETGMYLIEIAAIHNITGPNAQWEGSIQVIGTAVMIPSLFADTRWVASGGTINPAVSGFFRANAPTKLTVKADRFTGAAGAPGDNTVNVLYVAIAKFSEIPSAVQ